MFRTCRWWRLRMRSSSIRLLRLLPAAALVVLLVSFQRHQEVAGASLACSTFSSSSYVNASYAHASWQQDTNGTSGIQGHVAGTISYFGNDVMVTFGGTTSRTDDVSLIVADVTAIRLFTPPVVIASSADSGMWSSLTMVYFEADQSAVPLAAFKSAGVVFNNSLFVMGGHLGGGNGVSSSMFRADIEAFSVRGYGLWRGVTVTAAGSESRPSGRYGHSMTLLGTSATASGRAQAWVLLFGGMSAAQNLVSDYAHIVLLQDTGSFISCNATVVANALALSFASSVDCSLNFTPLRQYDTTAESWDLTTRVTATSATGPSARAYHAAATMSSDGAGGVSCVFLFGGWDYLDNTIMSDTWKLCPSQGGYLNVESDTTFEWTLLTSSTETPVARYGSTLLSSATASGVLGSYRLLLWGGSGTFPDLYMESAYEYDVHLGEWIDADLGGVTGVAPAGRRDHTLTALGNYTYVYGGINSDIDALTSLWRVNHSSSSCSGGTATTSCIDSSTSTLTSTVICVGCSAGFYSLANSYMCTSCPIGSYQVSGWSDKCTSCPAGSYGNPAAQGAVSKSQGCIDCPAGTASSQQGTATLSACVGCSAGYYSTAGSTSCTSCPSGSSSGANSGSCSSCSAGTYAVTTSGTLCMSCGNGQYSPFGGAVACLTCAAGYYSTPSASSCMPCSTGTYSSVGSTSCTSCSAGYYADQQGTAAQCTECPANTYRQSAGASSLSACLACAPGTYSNPGASGCTSCPAGTYYSSGSCIPCPVGTYSTVSGATNSSVCVSCSAGHYTTGTGNNQASDCLSCPPGTYSSSSTSPGCINCPRGTYTSTYTQAQAHSCQECSEGYHAPGLGAAACLACMTASVPTGGLSSTSTVAYNGFAACVGCDYNASCPIGANNMTCSDHGTCSLGFCECDTSFTGVDCSEGTCSTCAGVFGFAFGSHTRVMLEAESGTGTGDGTGVTELTVQRTVGWHGTVLLQVDVVGGNATAGVDYINSTGTWPLLVSFSDSVTSVVVVVPMKDNSVKDEGCRVLTLQLSVKTGDTSGARIVSYAGIRDLSATAQIAISEDDFSPAVISSTISLSGAGGGLGLSEATVMLGADSVDVTQSTGTAAFSVTVKVPSNTQLAAPLDIVLATETASCSATHLSRLHDLLAGVAADLQSTYNLLTMGVTSFNNSGNSALALADKAGNSADVTVSVKQTSTSNVYSSQQALQTVYADVLSNAYADSTYEGGGHLSALKTLSNNPTVWFNYNDDSSWRVVIMLTCTPFYFNSNLKFHFNSSTDVTDIITAMNDDITVAADAMRANHIVPLFLLTNEGVGYAQDYQTLIDTIGFGTVTYVDSVTSLSTNFNLDYLNERIVEGMAALATQAVLYVTDDSQSLVNDVTPLIYEGVTPGATRTFTVNFISAATAAFFSSLKSSASTVSLWYFGQHCNVTVVTSRDTCDETFGDALAIGGQVSATLDDNRRGWAQGFYDDEPLKWHGSGYSLKTDVAGPFGVLANILEYSGGTSGSSNGDVSASFTIKYSTPMPLVVKAYSKNDDGSNAMCKLTVTVYFTTSNYPDDVITLNWGAGTGNWELLYDVIFFSNVATGGTIQLKGKCDFANVGVFVHPEPACVCAPGYFLNTDSGPARDCTPQPSCRFFGVSECTYCPAGYFCPQGGTLEACSGSEYSMGGSSVCSACPAGWLCENGLAEPCGYGKGVRNTVEASGNCVTCPVGHHCKNGIAYSCPPGTYSHGGSHATRCVTCEPGTVAAQSGSSSCTACPAGHTSNIGTDQCYPCDTGQYSEDGQYPCSSCPPGMFSAAGAAVCSKCPVNSYSAYWSSDSCIDCPSGLSTKGQTAADSCS